MRTHIYNRMTAGEIEDYLARGGDTVFIAVGSTENHGVMPVEFKTVRTEGFAVALAEQNDGLALLNLPYFNPGATVSCSGTVHTSMELGYQYLMKICKSLVGQGFRKLFLLPSYRGITQIAEVFCRDFYETTWIHPVIIQNLAILPPTAEQHPKDKYGDFFEVTGCGAYRILQMEHTIPVYPDAEEDTCRRTESAPELRAMLREVRRTGSSFCQLYMDPGEHNGGIFFKTEEERDMICRRGEKLIREAVEKYDLTGMLRALEDYQAYTRRVVERNPRLQDLG